MAAIFIALTEPSIDIFQRFLVPRPHFMFGGFLLRLVEREPGTDVFYYKIHEHGEPDVCM